MNTLSLDALSRKELKLLSKKERFEKWMEAQISLMIFMQYLKEGKKNGSES
jgi:hypothetical protein